MGEGRKGERRQARRPPAVPRGERVLVYLIQASTCLGFPTALRSPRLRFCLFLAVERWLFTLFCEWAGLFCLLDLYDTYKVHDEAMKFNFAEGAYCDGRCITVELRLYPSSYRSEHLSRISWK